jgi:hypothetical protein
VLLDEVEALYAPQDHPVFELVPHTFHELVNNLYSSMGQPEITTDTFWDIYLELLKRLRHGQDEELADIITSHQNSMRPDQDMPLLPNMQPFRLGQPLDVGKNVNYIGGLDVSESISDPHPEYADFTTSDESDSDGSNVDI